MATSYGTQIYDVGEVFRQAKDVYHHEKSVQREFGPKIAHYTATPEEADAWWRSLDPINETFHLALDVAVAADDCKIIHEEMELNSQRMFNAGKAAVCIMSSVLLPEAFEDESKPWLGEVESRLPTFQADTEEEASHFYKLLLGLHYKLTQADSFYPDQIAKMIVSAEMLFSSVRHTYNLARDGQLLFPGVSEKHLFETINAEADFGNYIYNTAVQYINLPEHDEPEQTQVFDEIRMLGLRARIMQVAENSSHTESQISTHGEFRHNTELRRNEALDTLIQDLQCVFDNPELSITDRLRTPTIKGTLHEILWYLDTIMLRRMYPDKYGEITVMPAFDSADRPHVGNPKHRRGYDMVVKHENTYDYIQLKSSPQKGKRKVDAKYHPIITVLEEENFMDLQTKRLRAKLAAYRRLFDSGFPESEAQTVDKYALPTAKLAMDNILLMPEGRGEKMRKMLMKYRLPGVVEEVRRLNMNRGQRRAYDKKNRKK